MGLSRRQFLQAASATCAGISLRGVTTLWPQSKPWVHDISISSTDNGDLSFLKDFVGDARIVQLGENGHGTSEAMQVRARMARYLCEELSFGVLAFESSLFICHQANIDSTLEPTRLLTSSLIGVWHTHEMLPLFEYLVSTRDSRRRVQLAGIDVQPIGSGRKQRPAFFEKVVASADPEYGRTVSEFDSEFQAAYDQGSRPRREFMRANRERLIQGYRRLADFVDSNMVTMEQKVGREAALVARQEALSAAAYVSFQSAPDMKSYAEGRDEGMFQNLRFLAEELYPGQKIVVWAHNYHLRHNNADIPPSETIFPGVAVRTMGTWTREHFGPALRTIGQYEVSGRAVDNARKEYVIEQPGPEMLEARLGSLAKSTAFVDVAAGQDVPAGKWLQEPITARYNGQHPEVLTPAQQYDGMIIIPTVTPPKFLY